MAPPNRNRQPTYPSFSLVMCRYWAFVRFPVVRVVRGPPPTYQPYARPVEEADKPTMGTTLGHENNTVHPSASDDNLSPPQAGLKPSVEDSASEISVLDLNANEVGQK